MNSLEKGDVMKTKSFVQNLTQSFGFQVFDSFYSSARLQLMKYFGLMNASKVNFSSK